MKLLCYFKFFASLDFIQSHGFQVLCFSIIMNNRGRRMPKKSRFPVPLGYKKRNQGQSPVTLGYVCLRNSVTKPGSLLVT